MRRDGLWRDCIDIKGEERLSALHPLNLMPDSGPGSELADILNPAAYGLGPRYCHVRYNALFMSTSGQTAFSSLASSSFQ